MLTSKRLAEVVVELAQQRGQDLKTGTAFTIENPPWPTLSVEMVEEKIISIAHYQIQNEDLMADPEMIFYTATADGSWIPMYYRNDYLCLFKRALHLKDGLPDWCDDLEQIRQTSFANIWSQILKDQGFLEVDRQDVPSPVRPGTQHLPGTYRLLDRGRSR